MLITGKITVNCGRPYVRECEEQRPCHEPLFATLQTAAQHDVAVSLPRTAILVAAFPDAESTLSGDPLQDHTRTTSLPSNAQTTPQRVLYSQSSLFQH